jgi:hypothetical protein
MTVARIQVRLLQDSTVERGGGRSQCQCQSIHIGSTQSHNTLQNKKHASVSIKQQEKNNQPGTRTDVLQATRLVADAFNGVNNVKLCLTH